MVVSCHTTGIRENHGYNTLADNIDLDDAVVSVVPTMVEVSHN